FIATTATGASRDVGNVRPDVDTALGVSDGRAGWFVQMDWSRQPGGSQTYTVRGRTRCEWTQASFTVNVIPAPPAPAAGLSINDVSRTVGTSNVNNNLTTSCTQYNSAGQCIAVGSTNTGYYGSGCNY